MSAVGITLVRMQVMRRKTRVANAHGVSHEWREKQYAWLDRQEESCVRWYERIEQNTKKIGGIRQEITKLDGMLSKAGSIAHKEKVQTWKAAQQERLDAIKAASNALNEKIIDVSASLGDLPGLVRQKPVNQNSSFNALLNGITGLANIRSNGPLSGITMSFNIPAPTSRPKKP